jgi:hypothetical protein
MTTEIVKRALVVMADPGDEKLRAVVSLTDLSLAGLRETTGGRLIQEVVVTPEITAYCAEEGVRERLRRNPDATILMNRRISGWSNVNHFLGNVVFAQTDDDGNFVDITRAWVEALFPLGGPVFED